MDEEQSEPKIPLSEAIFVGFFPIIADAIEVVLVFFGLDDFWISDAIYFPASQIYFRMRGVKGTASLVTNALELLPYVGWLPLRTVGFVITVWTANHPQAAGALAAVAARGGAVKVGAGGAAKIGPRGTLAQAGAGGGQEAPPAPQRAAPKAGTGPQETTPLETPEQTVRRGPEISEEAFGVVKEPIEKVKETMEKIPEPEGSKT